MNDKIQVASAFRSLAPQTLGEGVGSGFSLIGFKGKVWSLRHKGETHYFTNDDDHPLPYIDVVILGENPNISKTYYPQGTYTEDAANQPTCSSLNGDVPDPGVPIPQSSTCGTCKRGQWTVLQTGNKGKECKDSKRVAVLLMPAMTAKMLDEPMLDPVMLRIPPASLRPLKSYSDSLVHRGVHTPAAVVTRITFERDRQFQMKFDLKQPLTNDEAPVIMNLLEDSQTQNILGKQAVIREIAPPKRETRTETGIMAAFGKGATVPEDVQQATPVPAKRIGRPPGSTNKPKQTAPDRPGLELAAELDDALPSEARTEMPQVPWEEADGELDDTLRKVVDQKIQGMLPK